MLEDYSYFAKIGGVVHLKSKLLEDGKIFSISIMITLFGCAQFFMFVSLLLYLTQVKMLKCAMLGAFIVCLICLKRPLKKTGYHLMQILSIA